MTSTTTYTLNVHLSLSQTRKRLKGQGFGVRKVEAADRNQAIIVHTATGQHLRNFEALFADVMPPEHQDQAALELRYLTACEHRDQRR